MTSRESSPSRRVRHPDAPCDGLLCEGGTSMSRNVVGTTISVALMVLLFALDLTVVATALPTITGEFHGAALYGWVFSAYAIPVTATTLLYGRIADILGRRRLFTIVVIGFLGGSIFCGFSQSMVELVIFRAVQGIFAGAIFPLAIGIIADIYPMERRAQGFSIVPTMFALAAVLGPTAGGFLTDTVGWRWIFFLNIPVVVAALTIFLRTYAPTARASSAVGLGDLDFAGFGAFATAIVVFLLALSLGGHELAWSSVPEILLGCLALAAFACFVWIERHARLPLLPLRLLRHRGLGGALLAIFLLSLLTNTMIVLIPGFAQGVLGLSARSAGVVLIPMMLSWALTANVAVRLGQRQGFRTVALPGVVALVAGLLSLSTVHLGSGQGALVLPMILLGIGAGLVNPNMMVLAQHSVSDRDQGLAGGLGNFALNLGAALTAPILISIELNRLTAHFGATPPDVSALLTAAGRHGLALRLGAATVTRLQHALDSALHDIFVLALLPAGALILWLLLVVPGNAQLARLRMGPLGAQRPAAPLRSPS
ncbi:MAG TPA: MFS transporter [Chloroflexota bacterium]|nr:MFS transporter [Chloroflexota bacterium]